MAETVTRKGGGSPQQGNGRRRSFSRDGVNDQFDHEVLEIARVVRVVKGGRRFRFRASVVVGDRAGTVGFGTGKSRDVQQAITKAQDQASKNTVTLNLQDGTISHSILSKYKGAVVLLRPARPGTGVIAGGTVRIVADLAGITDLVSKRYGSPNRISNARATIEGLQKVSVQKSAKQSKKKPSNNT